MGNGGQAGNLLLVLAHGDSVVKGVLGRRDTLLAMFEVMRKVNAATLLKCLKCLKLLTFDPALLQPLQVSPRPADHTFSSTQLSWQYN